MSPARSSASGAPPIVFVKRDPGHCRTPGGLRSAGRPLQSGSYHRAREEAAARLQEEILRRGEEARRELSALAQ